MKTHPLEFLAMKTKLGKNGEKTLATLAQNFITSTGVSINPIMGAKILGERVNLGLAPILAGTLGLLICLTYGLCISWGTNDEETMSGVVKYLLGSIIGIVGGSVITATIIAFSGSNTTRGIRRSYESFVKALEWVRFIDRGNYAVWESIEAVSKNAHDILVRSAWEVQSYENDPSIGSHHDLTLEARKRFRIRFDELKLIGLVGAEAKYTTYYEEARAYDGVPPGDHDWGKECRITV